jgi:RNA polymerase sigma factor (sigma-70 family)
MRWMRMTDEERLQQFGAFYERTKTPVFRAVLLSRAGARHEAEDAVAEAYERAFLRWNKLAAHPNPTAWVIRTAINHRISTWRKRRSESTSPPEREAPPSVDGLDPDLVRLIRDLPKGQRNVLALRILLDFNTQETADALGVRQGTVKTQLHRALSRLRAQLLVPHSEEA